MQQQHHAYHDDDERSDHPAVRDRGLVGCLVCGWFWIEWIVGVIRVKIHGSPWVQREECLLHAAASRNGNVRTIELRRPKSVAEATTRGIFDEVLDSILLRELQTCCGARL